MAGDVAGDSNSASGAHDGQATPESDGARDLVRYRQLVENASDPMLVLDEDSTVELCNEAFASWFDRDRGALVGSPLTDLLSGAGADRIADALAALDDADEKRTCQLCLSDDDGTEHSFETTVSPIDAGGEATEYVATLTDVTVHVRRKAKLALLKQVLARVLRHDVRSELTVIRGHAEVLRERAPAAVSEFVTTIIDHSERLAETTEKARAIAGVLENDAEPKTVALGPVVDRAVDTVTTAHPDAEVDVHVDVDDAPVVAHPAFQYAVENLVENAVEHGSTSRAAADATSDAVEHGSTSRAAADATSDAVEHGSTDAGTAVTVVAEERDADETDKPDETGETDDAGEGWIELRVADEGPGIPQEEIEIIERGEETPLEHGTGVGLWLVDWIVDRSGGRLSFDTGTAGTTVTIELERARSDTLAGTADVPAEGPAKRISTTLDPFEDVGVSHPASPIDETEPQRRDDSEGDGEGDGESDGEAGAGDSAGSPD